MFANDKNIDNLQQLLAELKKYAELQKDYVKLHLVEKLTILISTLILVFILLILGIIALFYLSFTLAYVLEPHVGGLMASYGIITGCIILLILLIVLFRKRLIVQPMVNFLANLLLNDAFLVPKAFGEEFIKPGFHTLSAHDRVLLDQGQNVVPHKVQDEAACEAGKHECEDDWQERENAFLHGVFRRRVERLHRPHGDAIENWKRADADDEADQRHAFDGFRRNDAAEQAKTIEQRCWVWRCKVFQPQKAFMAHLNRDIERFVERKEDRDCRKDRQTARNRVRTCFLVKFHDFLLLALAVCGETLADFFHWLRQFLHFRHGAIRRIVEWEQHQFYKNGEAENCQAK